MPSTLSRSLLIFALLVFAVVSWQWIDDRDAEPLTASNPIEMAQTESDYYLENFEIINISNNSNSALATTSVESNSGMPADRQLKITGQSLSHHYVDGHSIIQQPIVSLQSIDNGQWHAVASTGTVSANFDVLDLQGDVALTHHRTAASSQVSVDTNSLSIDTSNRTISSRESVQVQGDGWHYNASSMNAEIDRGTLSFTSGVEAQFESPNR